MAAALACGGSTPAPPAPSGPPIELTLPALDGGEFALSEYRGKVLVVHVFSTSVPSVHSDVEQLAALTSRQDPDTVVVGVALDAEGRQFVSPWRHASGATYLIGLATEDVRSGRSALGPIQHNPTTLILDRGGHVVRRIERNLQPDEVAHLVNSVLSGS